MTTTAPQRRAASMLQHAGGCTYPKTHAKRDAATGRAFVFCPSCGAQEWSDVLLSAPAPPPPIVIRTHACRAHYRPVSWRGTGCPQCDAETRQTRKTRRAARLAETE